MISYSSFPFLLPKFLNYESCFETTEKNTNNFIPENKLSLKYIVVSYSVSVFSKKNIITKDWIILNIMTHRQWRRKKVRSLFVAFLYVLFQCL